MPGLEARPPHHHRLLGLWTRGHARRRGLVPTVPPATAAAARRPTDGSPHRLAPAVLRRHVQAREAIRATPTPPRAPRPRHHTAAPTRPTGPPTETARPSPHPAPTGASPTAPTLRAATSEDGVVRPLPRLHARRSGHPTTLPALRIDHQLLKRWPVLPLPQVLAGRHRHLHRLLRLGSDPHQQLALRRMPGMAEEPSHRHLHRMQPTDLGRTTRRLPSLLSRRRPPPTT